MIKIISGVKGSGKTKKILDMANDSLAKVKGDVVFLAATSRYRAEVKPQIKFVDIVSEGITTKEALKGFIKGVLSTNYDVECVFIDGFYKMIDVDVDSPEAAELFLMLDGLSKNIDFVLTVSCADADLPKFIAKYAD